jgi:hypothetical protein
LGGGPEAPFQKNVVRIEILDQAEQDLLEGFHFYEDQEPGLGAYFLTNLFQMLNRCGFMAASIASPAYVKKIEELLWP